MRGFYPGQAEGRRRRLHLLFLAALVLAKAGSALIRENVPDVATHLKDFHVPTLLPGITVTTSPTDYSVINRFQDPTVRERPLGSGRKDILGKRGSRPQSPSNCHSINSLLVPQELVHRKTPIAKAMMPRRGEQNEPPVMPPSSSLISFGRSRLTGGVAVSTWTPRSDRRDDLCIDPPAAAVVVSCDLSSHSDQARHLQHRTGSSPWGDADHRLEDQTQAEAGHARA